MRSSALKTEISISSCAISSGRTGGNRVSFKAALIAERATTSARGPGFSTCPTHPRRLPARCRVTKAPRRSASALAKTGKSGMDRSRTALEIARRAMSTSVSQSSLDSRDILRVLGSFENSQAAALLDAAVNTAPKFLKILEGGNHRAAHYKPQQQDAEGPERCVLRRQDQRANRDHLQHHFGLAEPGCRNRESLGGRN